MANVILQLAPDTETTFDSIPSSLVSDINIFVRNCEALIWVLNAIYFSGYIQTACKQAHFIAVSHICVLNSAQCFPLYESLLYGTRAIHRPALYCFWDLFL